MIKLPPGSHPDAPQDDLSFIDLMTKPGALDPPDTSRGDAMARLTVAVRNLETAVQTFSRAVYLEAGQDHLDARVSVSIKNVLRKNAPLLAKLVGLSK
jgi:hypothetical protein